MKRAAIISAVIASALLALIALLWVGLFHTPPGRTMLSTVIEDQLGGALNSEVKIGRFDGSPPGHIVIEDVTFDDAGSPWATVRRLELRWRPFALLRKRIVVDLADVEGAYLLRNPPERETDTDDSEPLNLSISAPNLSVAEFNLSDLRAEVNGQTERLDGTGSVKLNGPDISLRITLTSSGGFDQADVTLEKTPLENQFYLDGTLIAEVEGVIASLLGLEGPLRITAAGDGAIDNAAITITGVVGEYGDLNAAIAGDLNRLNGADLKVDFAAGDRLAQISELSEPVSLDARFALEGNDGLLNIRSLTSAAGTISGDLRWRAPGGEVDQLSTALDVSLAESYRNDIQTYLGSTVNLSAQLNWRRDDYGLTAAISSGRARIDLLNGQTDLGRKLSGEFSAVLNGSDALPAFLAQGAQANAVIDADLDRSIRAANLSFATNDGAAFSGNAEYAFTDSAITTFGDFNISREALRTIAPDVIADGPVTGDLNLSGPAERFSLTANFETPQLAFSDGALPPMVIDAQFAGLPSLPTGDILATARNGAPRRLEAQLRSSENGLIRAPKILYAGKGFRLEGSGDFNPGPQTANLDLAFQGQDDAQPWPGVTMLGDFEVRGVVSRDGALNNLNANAENLSVNDISVTGFKATAEGPPGAVDVAISGSAFAAPGAPQIADYDISAQLNLQDTLTILLSQFEALVSDNRARLTEAATITLQNGVKLDNIRLAYGSNGAISVDGAFSNDHWLADARLQSVNIPGADGQVTMTLELDTNAETPARADFMLRSLLLNKEEASIAGNALWDGATLTLTDDDADEKIDMRIVLPAALTRSPKVGISTDGALDGFVRYDGDIQALAAYLPPSLQTMEGKLTADFNLGGDTSAPDLSGSANLSEGAYTELSSGFSLAGLHAQAQAEYTGGQSIVTFMGGARGADQSREDSITFSGDLTVGESSRINLDVDFDNAEMSAHPINTVRANGFLKIAGPFDGLEANGEITVDELDAEIITPESTGLVDIEVVSYNDDGPMPDNVAEERNSGIAYAIKLTADDRIFIRGRGLESEWSANVDANNGREGPVITGNLSLRRGWLDFSGRRFDLTRGAIRFDRISVNNPSLDIRAEHDTSDGVTAAIVISGRAQEPSISLQSTPSLPQEDVMSLILFGKPAQELSPFESLQAAEALASLSGIGPFGGEGITGRLRNAVGLDLLNVDIDPQNGGGSLTVGKYVADGFFVSATQDAEGKNGAVRVKYEITDNITVETELEQTGDQTVSANWERDF
ncbi:translocation/assembly module TamB domain-containing protein [Hyphococcus flavus]|uniref:Translocation/assembly module TamB domain-containing protein n=1 Tax=Hyphococcus flavus TaxID=1866326 RepID=A0AAF0CE89_9PROT|nr:translocation/assembly module TamB domain-containing protein [Hyphococcus flavus]WDI30896.1 translocation/assembly module TamB domain-containing protein [Hyphococcus flavus]